MCVRVGGGQKPPTTRDDEGTDSFQQHWFTLWFSDRRLETQHRQWQMSSVAGPAFFVSLVYGVSNYLNDDWSVASEHPLLAVAVAAHVFLPLITAMVYFFAWWTKSQSMYTLAAFEISIVLQILADGFSQAIIFGFRGMPIPAGVFGIACNTPLAGQSWVNNALMSCSCAIIYYLAQCHWHPENASKEAMEDTFRAFIVYVLVGYLGDRSLRTQSQARFRLLSFKKDLNSSMQTLLNGTSIPESESYSSDGSSCADSSSSESDDDASELSLEEFSINESEIESDWDAAHGSDAVAFENARNAAQKVAKKINGLQQRGLAMPTSSSPLSKRLPARRWCTEDKQDCMSSHAATPSVPDITPQTSRTRPASKSPTPGSHHSHRSSSRRKLFLKPKTESEEKSRSLGTDTVSYLRAVLEEAQHITHMLAAAERRQSRFLATMSHELRSPLTSTIACAEMLASVELQSEEATLGSKQLEMAHLIKSSGDHLLALVNDILDFCKLAARGKFKLKPISFDVAKLGMGVSQLYQRTATTRGVELQYVARIPSGLHLYGDETRIRQILNNLVSNAIKFTPRNGRVVLQLSVQRARKPHPSPSCGSDSSNNELESDCILECMVSDTGKGMTIADQRRLFQPFVQVGDAANSSSNVTPSTGLGLSISARLARLMGCPKIEVKSAPGKGSTFTAQLHLREISPDSADVAENKPQVQPTDIGNTTENGFGKTTANIFGLRDTRSGLDVPQASEGDDRPGWITGGNTLSASRGGEQVSTNPVSDTFSMNVVPSGLRRRKLATNPPSSSITKDKSRPSPRPLQGKRVLLVEDMSSLRRVGAMMLRSVGAEVVLAENGIEAVDRVAESSGGDSPIDCILMDVHMPEMDGLQALREISARHGADAPPVVSLTGDVMDGMSQLMLDTGAVAVLSKPYRRDELTEIVLKHSRTRE